MLECEGVGSVVRDPSSAWVNHLPPGGQTPRSQRDIGGDGDVSRPDLLGNVIVDDTEVQLLEQVGVALDALRLSGIVLQVFPAIKEKHAAWEVARTFLAAEEEVRQVMADRRRPRWAMRKKLTASVTSTAAATPATPQCCPTQAPATTVTA